MQFWERWCHIIGLEHVSRLVPQSTFECSGHQSKNVIVDKQLAAADMLVLCVCILSKINIISRLSIKTVV